MRVGTSYTPLAFIIFSVSSVRKLPCSIESTPAAIASRAAASPWQWAATLRPHLCASVMMRAEFLRGELRHVDRVGLRQHAAAGGDLDDVRAPLHLVAHRLAALVRPGADALDRPVRLDALGREGEVIDVAAGGADRVHGREDPRTGGDARR